jgi:hypothetical protein
MKLRAPRDLAQIPCSTGKCRENFANPHFSRATAQNHDAESKACGQIPARPKQGKIPRQQGKSGPGSAAPAPAKTGSIAARNPNSNSLPIPRIVARTRDGAGNG